MTIRPETVADYGSIAALHARAFGNRAAEAAIVALHRQRAAFDPELSLVAELDGRIVGHALFSPHVMRLLDQSVPAVNLAPIAVEPAYQRRGIGSSLMHEGHAVAAAKGYTVSFLLGHSGYYPRFGYLTHAYGDASAPVDASAGEAPGMAAREAPPVVAREPADGDVPSLRALWLHDEGGVDFALDPGPDLLDWISPNPAVRAIVYVHGDGDNVVGYARVRRDNPAQVRAFLAAEPVTARAMAAHLARDAGASVLMLPIHPASRAGDGFAGLAACRPSAAAMARSLAPSPLDDYLAQVQAGHRPPGRPTWPVAFDL